METIYTIIISIFTLCFSLFTYILFKTTLKLKHNLHLVNQDFHWSAYIFYEMIIEKYSIKEKLKAVETFVNISSNVVEGLHKTIADLAFQLLEQSSSLSTTKVHKARQFHDGISFSLYDIIRNTNKGIGQISDSILGIQNEDEESI